MPWRTFYVYPFNPLITDVLMELLSDVFHLRYGLSKHFGRIYTHTQPPTNTPVTQTYRLHVGILCWFWGSTACMKPWSVTVSEHSSPNKTGTDNPYFYLFVSTKIVYIYIYIYHWSGLCRGHIYTYIWLGAHVTWKRSVDPGPHLNIKTVFPGVGFSL